MTIKKCMGCGATLQTENKEETGYVKSLDLDVCQSCFRLKHYRDFKHVKANVDEADTLAFIEDFEGHIFWVVDVMHLNQSLHDGLIRALSKKDVVLVVNKRDLLAKSVSNRKLEHAIMRMLRDYQISLMDLIFVSSNIEKSLKPLIPYLEDSSVAFVGCINAGKSSLLNALLEDEQLSVSPVSSTTAGIIHIEHERYDVYDTPGFVKESSLIEKYTDRNLIQLAPQKEIKPQIFQIYEKQALMIGNLGAIIVDPKTTAQIISYLPFPLKRVKPDRVDVNLELEHEFMIENPKYRKKMWPVRDEKIDLEIFDLGFITISGKLKSLETKLDETAETIIRKAII